MQQLLIDIPSVVKEIFSEYEYVTLIALRDLAYSRVWSRDGLKGYGTLYVDAQTAFGNAVEEYIRDSFLYKVHESKFTCVVSRNIKPIDKAS